MRRVYEERVCDETVLILTRRLPLGEGLVGKEDRFAGGVPVKVVIKRANVGPQCPLP